MCAFIQGVLNAAFRTPWFIGDIQQQQQQQASNKRTGVDGAITIILMYTNSSKSP